MSTPVNKPEPEETADAIAEGFALAGLSELSETEQETELAEIGSLLVERAFTTFLRGLEESQQHALEAFVEAHGQADDFIERLVSAYPDFAAILEAEMVAYRAALLQTFGSAE